MVYSQCSVHKGDGAETGWTIIDVEVPGNYQIALRRWPRESGLAICSDAPAYPMKPETHSMAKIKNKVFDVTTARLQVGEFDQTQSVSVTDQEIVFDVDLKKGEQRLETWFTMKDGSQKAAYYTYIEPL